MFLKSITTKHGHKINFSQLSIFVGPNNSGKSRTLRDIYDYFSSKSKSDIVSLQIVKEIDADLPKSFDELIEGLLINRQDYMGNGDLIKIKGFGIDAQIHAHQFEELKSGNLTSNYFQQFSMIRLFNRIRYLNAESRLTSASSSQEGLLKELYDDATKEIEQELRKAFKAAFGLDIVLDYSSRQTLSLRVAQNLNNIPPDPREAQSILSQHETIEQQGDGFRSFVGVVLSVLLSKNRLILIDEPEAFLHHTQARILGGLLARLAQLIQGQVVISTHSSSFIAGLLSAERGVSIYRLNRTDNQTTFTLMPEEITLKLTTEPLLASQRVVEAIFQEGVVVCEADRDRLVYQAVANRQLHDHNVFFLHADNKQTLHHIVSLMTQLAIPVAAIADIDVLDDPDTLRRLLLAFGHHPEMSEALDARDALASTLQQEKDADVLARLKTSIYTFQQQLQGEQHTLEGIRSALKRLLDEASTSVWRPLKRGGVAGLQEPAQTHAIRAIQACRACGLLIVPVGELEQWINLSVNKQRWPVKALNTIYAGESPQTLTDFVADALALVRRSPSQVELQPTNTGNAV